jgi:uncharacterized alpha-E superfamily protein
MLSRVANSVYWIARYLERAENTARVINVNTNLVLDTPKGMSPGWEPLVMITGGEKRFAEQYPEFNERNVIRFLLTDAGNGVSVLNALTQARENARTVRDVLPREVWEELNNLYLYARDNIQQGQSKRGRYEYIKTVIRGVQQLTGMLSGTMSNNMPYDFMVLGRNLERADMTLRIIDVRSASLLSHETELRPFDNIQWMSVLKSLSGYQMYRQHMGVRVNRQMVLQFLLQDRHFPRAIHHCVLRAESALRDLPRHQPVLPSIEKMKKVIAKVDVSKLDSTELHDFIDVQEGILAEVGKAISAVYFTPESLPLADQEAVAQ